MINKKLWGLFMGENKRSVVPFAIIVICALITIVALIWGITETVNAKKLKAQITEIESENQELQEKLDALIDDEGNLLVVDTHKYYLEKMQDDILYYNIFMTIAQTSRYLGLTSQDADIDKAGEQMFNEYQKREMAILLNGKYMETSSEEYKQYETYFDNERIDLNLALMSLQSSIKELSTQ